MHIDKDSKKLLFRRLEYNKRALALREKNLILYDQAISKVQQMIEDEELKTYLEVDSTFYFLVEKIREGHQDVDEHADEIKGFIIES